MEKLVIHKIGISKAKEKHTFQIYLPENAEAITGIFVTTDRYQITGVATNKVERSTGILQLFASDTGEHLYSDNPKNTFSVTREQATDEIFSHKLWTYCTNMGMLDTWQPVSTTILDGFYQDFVGTLTESVTYNIRVYLRLKLRKQ